MAPLGLNCPAALLVSPVSALRGMGSCLASARSSEAVQDQWSLSVPGGMRGML